MTTNTSRLISCLGLAFGLGHAALAGGVQLTQLNSGVLQWTDRAGTTHLFGGNGASTGINIQFWDDDTHNGGADPAENDVDDLLGSNRTAGVTGRTGIGTSHNDFGTHLEAFMQAQADFGGVGTAGPVFGQTWQTRVPAGAFFNVPEFNNQVNDLGGGTVTNALNTGRMIGVLHGLDFMSTYFESAHGATLPAIQIRYDMSQGANVIGTNMGFSQMNLQFDDWADWDVVFHEYGHHVAEYNNLDWRNPMTGGGLGLNHSSNRDNIGPNNNGRNYGAVTGSRLAWQEGIATVLGLMAVNDGNMQAAIPGLPAADYDQSYQDINHAANLNTVNETMNPNLLNNALVYSLENRMRRSGMNVIQTPGQGEGDELSVSRILWDIKDNTPGENYANGSTDRVNFGPAATYNLMKQTLGANDNGNGTLHSFTERLHAALANDATRQAALGLPAGSTAAQAMAITGDTYEEYGVSSTNLTQGQQPRLRPFLRWTEQNNDNSANFGAILYDANWNFVEASLLTPDANANILDTFTWRPTNPLVPGATYHWVALNSAAVDGAANPGGFDHFYWSGARLITAIPTPGTLALASLGTLAIVRRRRLG